MDVDVCVPFRGDGAERTRNWEFLREQWHRTGLPVYEADAIEGAAASRNAAIRLGSGDVVVQADADMLAPVEMVVEAAQLAASTGGYVAAHTDLHYLTDEQTVRLIGGEKITRGELEIHNRTWFGLVAFPRSLWETVGGFDERFGEWGRFEISFWYACRTLAPISRVPGAAFHLWHPPRPFVTTTAADVLAERYKAADGFPVAMRALLAEQRVAA